MLNNTDAKVVNTIRLLSVDTVQKANSGHPGLPLGAAPLAYELWAKHMKHNPQNPEWANRDRFVLSAGHGSALVYSLLHLFGYGLTIEDLKNFRQYESLTPGHPEYGHTKGVETTTGPLGQGFANGVGMAMAEAHLASKFNKPGYKVVDHNTYVVVGDGCLMEGISSEAASLAGTLELGKLVVLYDSNSITIEGCTDIAFKEDVQKRFEAYNWQVLKVDDGNDTEKIGKAIEEAKADSKRPSLIIVTTAIGYGCPAKQGKASSHGEPLGEENVRQTKVTFGFNPDESFAVGDDVKKHMESIKLKLSEYEMEWNKLWDKYKVDFPESFKEWNEWFSKEIPEGIFDDESLWEFNEKANATRSSSGDILNKISQRMPNLIGGSADLAPSNKTVMQGKGDFSAENYSGSNLHFGVREHAMGAIVNGIALHGGLLPYAATFFVFCDYMKPAIRLAALMSIPVIYVFTHDSIGVGEDGPTHQPIEHLASLRCIPNMVVFRPADTKETAAGWYSALQRKDGPTALVLTRQNLPQYKETGKDAMKGAYVLMDGVKATPDVILMASGSEVQLAYEAGKKLNEKGIGARVVSMPSWELFEKQSAEYKEKVLPKAVTKRLAVEAGCSMGWHRYVGSDGDVVAIDTFGASANSGVLFKAFGFTVENVVEKAIGLMK